MLSNVYIKPKALWSKSSDHEHREWTNATEMFVVDALESVAYTVSKKLQTLNTSVQI